MAVSKEKGLLRLTGIDSGHILELLKHKHSNDVFIPECKNGETWGVRDLLKMDAWVLRRSYSPLTTIGYEIKCHRQNFEQDQKWTKYLDLCHEFYFVCPGGLIRATDLPSRVGIIWASKAQLHTKRKAERVEPDLEKLNRLLIYVVMARSKIVDSMYERDVEQKSKLEQIRETVETAKAKKDLAYFVRGHIREVYESLASRDAYLPYRENQIKSFEDKLARLGITWNAEKDSWQDTIRVENEIDALKQLIDPTTLHTIKALSESLTRFIKQIDDWRNEGVKGGGSEASLIPS